MKNRIILFIVLTVIITELKSIPLDSIVPLTFCTTAPKSIDDLNQAYNQYSNAFLLLKIQQIFPSQIAQKINNAQAQMASLYNEAAKVSSSSVEYPLLMAKTVYAMFLNVLQAIADALLTPGQLDSSALQQTLEQTYQQVRDSIKSSKSASIIIQSGINAMKQSVCTFATKVELALKVVTYSQDQQKKIDDTQKLLKEKIDYLNAYRGFIQTTQPLYVQLISLFSSSQKIINDMIKTKQYDQKAVSALAASYTTLIQSYVQAYKKANIVIHQKDATNLVVVALRNLAYFFLQSITAQLNWYTFSKEKDLGILNDLALRIIGTQNAADEQLVKSGYDGFLKTLIENNFGANTGDIQSYYTNEKIKRIFSTYQTVLNQLANITNPTDQHVQYAEHFFSVLDALTSQLPVNVQSSIAFGNHLALGAVYAARGSTILSKEMFPTNPKNDVLLNQVISYFNNAATHYVKAANPQLATMYQNFADTLKQAIADKSDAQAKVQAGNIDQALTLFSKAHDEFIASADAVDANIVASQMASVAATYYGDQAKKAIQDFINAYKASFQAYMTFISSPDAQNPGIDFKALFSALVVMNNTVIKFYQQSIDRLSTLASSKSTSDQIYQLQQAVDALSAIVKAQALMDSGTLAAQLNTAADLSRAESYFSQALSLFASADKIIEKNPALSAFVLVLTVIAADTATNWNYQTLANRAIARLYVDQAHQVTDSTLSTLYYTYANNRASWLSKAMTDFLTNQIAAVQKNQQAIDQIFKQATDAQAAALQMPAAAWQPFDKTKVIYDSQASQAWQGVLRTFWSAYQAGKTDALASFIKAANDFATAYKQNVDTRFYPLFGAALIVYNVYIAYRIQDDQQNSAAVLSAIEKSTDDFFGQVTQLMANVNNPALISTATPNQQKVIEWIQVFDHAIDQQTAVLNQLASARTDQDTMIMFSKTIDSLSNVSCTFIPTNKVVTIPNPTLMFAQVYEKVGDYYFSQKNYYPAWTSYVQATNYYNQAKIAPSVTLKNNTDLAQTRGFADEYFQFIVPQETVKINGFTIPKRYTFKLYQEKVPAEIVGLVNFSTITTENITDFSMNIASLMYLYHKIVDYFGTGQFLYYYSIIQQQQESTLSDDQQAVLASIISDWKEFIDTLTKRVQNKEVSVVVVPPTDPSKPVYLMQYNIPIPAFISLPEYPGPYKGYPFVLWYYPVAKMLYAPGTTNVTLGTYSLVPGNDPDNYKKVTQGILYAYLNEGYQFKEQIDAINTSSIVQKLKTIAKNDMSVDVTTFENSYNALDDLYTKMITFYAYPLSAQAELLAAQDPAYQSLTNLVANTYKSWADNLALFLVGNPTSPNGKYQIWLNKISSYYSAAILGYGYSADLWKTIAQLYESAGDILINEKNFFGAVAFFATAEEFYKKFYQQGTSPDILRVQLKQSAGYFYGATYNMKLYQQLRSQPQTITLCTGEQTTLSFQEILARYDGWKTQAVGTDSAIIDKATLIKSTILDALIYYGAMSNMLAGFASDVDQSIGQAAQSFADTQKSGTTTATNGPTQSPEQKKATDLITTFFQQSNINFDTLPTIFATMARSDFPDFIIAGFDQFKQNIQASSDASTIAANYLALSLLAERLYSAFSQIYINDFLTGLDQVTAQNALSQDIETEGQTIQAPFQQYSGQTSC